MVAAKLANMEANTGVAASLQSPTSRAEAASMLNVSERSVNTAKKVEREGSPELIKQVSVHHTRQGSLRGQDRACQDC